MNLSHFHVVFTPSCHIKTLPPAERCHLAPKYHPLLTAHQNPASPPHHADLPLNCTQPRRSSPVELRLILLWSAFLHHPRAVRPRVSKHALVIHALFVWSVALKNQLSHVITLISECVHSLYSEYCVSNVRTEIMPLESEESSYSCRLCYYSKLN